MNSVYFPIFCGFFLPTRGEISLAILRSPEKNPENVNLRIDGSIDLGSSWNYSHNVQDPDKVAGTSPDYRDIRDIGAKALRDDQDLWDNRDNVQHYREDNHDNAQWNNEGNLDTHDTLQWDNQNKWVNRDDIQWHREHNEDNRDNSQWNNMGTLDKRDTVPEENQDQWHDRDNVQQYTEDNRDNRDNVQWNNMGTLDIHDTVQQENQEQWHNRDNVQQYTEDNRDNRDKVQWNNMETLDIHDDTVIRDNQYQWDNRDTAQRYREDNKDNRDKVQENQDQWHNRDNVQQYTEDNRDNRDNVQWNNMGTLDTVQHYNHEQWDNRDTAQTYREDIIDNRDKVLRDKKDRLRIDMASVGFTRLQAGKTTLHKVKDVERTKEFTTHIYMQTMKVFDSIKKKITNENMQAKVDQLARSYKEQFADFVQQQRETTVKTKMGDQRVILHTMETSNLMLQRLVNFLKADMEKAGGAVARVNDNTLQKEVDTAKELEYKHVCTKYGYCRTDKGFNKMLQNCIKILVTVSEQKMLQARDAITEELKTSDFHKVLDSKTNKEFKRKINRLETKEPDDIREALKVLLGILSNAHSPLIDEGGNSKIVRKTAALYQFLEMWEEAMPADETNKLEWADIEKSLGDWSAGKRTDVFEIVQALGRNVRKGLNKLDPDAAVRMKEQVKIIRG